MTRWLQGFDSLIAYQLFIMSSIESYDGLCALHAPFASFGLRLRCKHPMSHHGPCSWEKYRSQFVISSYCGRGDYLEVTDKDGFKRGFIDSVVYHNYEHIPISINSKGKLKIK